MKADILSNIDNPRELERLYRRDKSEFRNAFNSLYPQLADQRLADFWNERLNYEPGVFNRGARHELLYVLLGCALAGLLVKIPAFFRISEAFFYPRNIAFVVLSVLAAYFIWKNELRRQKVIVLVLITLAALLYINLLPGDDESHTLILACLHLPLLLWGILGLSFTGKQWRSHEERLDFLRYNGDLVVIYAVMAIAGMLLAGFTISLFSLIGLEIEDFYFNYVVLPGAAAAPLLGTYLIRTNPQLVNKISPVIAKIFSPLVLLTLIIYFVAIILSGKDPYNDREFLILFNGLLVGVMAIILFSTAESSRGAANRAGNWILFLLSVATIVINLIALSAIVFRISEWGITPNRLAVLGGNVLILAHLLIVTYQLFRSVRHGSTLAGVERAIADFLPVYVIWAVVVSFGFPVAFGFV